MNFINKIDCNELSEYITAIVNGITEGLNDTDYKISNDDKIVLELSVINTKKTEGGLKIYVLDVSKHSNKEELSKITIPIRRKQYSLVY